MTIFELIFFLLMVSIGILAARVLYPIGGTWLSVAGFIAGVFLIPSMFFAYYRYRRWAYRGDQQMPECSCGSSVFKYYKIGEEHHLLCQQCKTRYARHGDEVSVFENGVEKPYKRLMKHQGWI